MSYEIPNFLSRIQYFLHQSKLIKMRGQKHRSKMMQRQPSQMNNSGMKVSMTNQKHRSEMMQRQPSQMNNSGMKVSLIVKLNVMVQEQQVIIEFHFTKFDYFYSVLVKVITKYAPTCISY